MKYDTSFIIVVIVIVSIVTYLMYKKQNTKIEWNQFFENKVKETTSLSRQTAITSDSYFDLSCTWRGICDRGNGMSGVCMSGKCYPSTHTNY